jgi:hypothetical protein
LLLQAERFGHQRKELERIFARRARRGAIGLDDYLKIRAITGTMKAELAAEVRQLPPMQFVTAKSFLESLAYEAELPAS